MAPVIRLIYKKFIDGEGIISITKDLNEMGIPNPSMYKQLKGWNYKHPAGKNNDGLWHDSSVRRILQNEMYIGNMVLKANISERIAALHEMIENLKKTEQEYSLNISDENEFIAHFKKYHGIEKLARSMLVELIDAIYVHEGGRINVKIKQSDAFEKALDYIEEHRKVS